MTKDELKDILWSTFGHLEETQLMALVIYGEARGESREGKIAVGSVILERRDDGKNWNGKTIHEVCLTPKQFSCLLPADPNFHALKLIAEDWDKKSMRSMVMSDCYNVAYSLLHGLIPRTKEIAECHATNYKTTTCKAKWAEKMKKVLAIGNHEFYAEGKP